MKAIFASIALISLTLLQLVYADEVADLNALRVQQYLGLGKRSLAETSSPTRKPTKVPTMKPTQKPTTPYKSTKLVSGDWITGFDFLPDGQSVVMVERFSGMIHTYNMTTNTTAMIGKINGISTKGQSNDGLIGVAVDPNFSTSSYIYVYASRHQKGKEVDQVIKLKWDASMKGMLGKQQVIWSLNRIKGAENQGGRIKFGPDGYLYVTVGDQDKASLAQDMKSDAGKILRLTNTGGVPEDNPVKKSRMFAYGYRNSIGLAFDPKTDSIWSTDNGPTCNDEVNLITKGSNYGWGPKAVCPDTNQDGENIQVPKKMFNGSPRAVTGLTFAWTSNDLYIGHLIPSGIRKLTLDSTRANVQTDGGIIYYLPEDQGFLLALESDSQGNFFYSTVTGVYKLTLKKA